MTVNDVFALIVPAISGLVISLILEFMLLVPRQCCRLYRCVYSYAVHAGSWLCFFIVCLMLFQRPVFAVLLTTSFQLLLLAVNNAKYHSLREPFILQDFEYFIDLIKHPRLYLPFLGSGKLLLEGAHLLLWP